MNFILASLVWIVIGLALGWAILKVAAASVVTVATLLPLAIVIGGLVLWMACTGYRAH